MPVRCAIPGLTDPEHGCAFSYWQWFKVSAMNNSRGARQSFSYEQFDNATARQCNSAQTCNSARKPAALHGANTRRIACAHCCASGRCRALAARKQHRRMAIGRNECARFGFGIIQVCGIRTMQVPNVAAMVCRAATMQQRIHAWCICSLIH